MRARTLTIFVLFLFVWAVPLKTQAQSVMDGPRVKKAVYDWLALLEEKQYGRSWEATSTVFKQSTQRQDWVVRVQGFRSSLGSLVSRTPMLMQYAGSEETRQTCTVTFFTQYENRTFQRESILLVFEEENWLVAGYYVK